MRLVGDADSKKKADIPSLKGESLSKVLTTIRSTQYNYRKKVHHNGEENMDYLVKNDLLSLQN